MPKSYSPRRRRRSMSGAHIKSVRARICAGCEGYLRPEDRQCPSCGRLDTITFDSHAELRRWGELRLLEKSGRIRELKRQVTFELNALGGNKIGKYIADFTYLAGLYEVRTDEGKVVEDVKGGDAKSYVDTPLSSWKRRHCEAQYNLTVTIVAR